LLNDIEYLRLKANQYDSKIKCPVCNVKDKEVILPCFHMFCEECMNKNIDSRQRQCPLDRLKISKNDIKKIPWGDGGA
jgi:E3 ubiquitin-protein ligase BRE1